MKVRHAEDGELTIPTFFKFNLPPSSTSYKIRLKLSSIQIKPGISIFFEILLLSEDRNLM